MTILILMFTLVMSARYGGAEDSFKDIAAIGQRMDDFLKNLHSPKKDDSTCEDLNEECKKWSESGECGNNPDYMHLNCRKSCKVCGECADLNEKCVTWSGSGECEKNPNYMKIYCKKSCKVCGEEIKMVGDTIVDPDEPNMEQEAVDAGKGQDADLAPFPLFSWHKKVWRLRTIPYLIRQKGKDRSTILKSISRFRNNFSSGKFTCLKFRPKRSSDKNWIEFTYGYGCYAGIGRKYWKQGRQGATKITLGRDCYYNSVIQHELLHALGFLHEQSRIDRDTHVQILEGNMQSGMASQFKKSRPTEAHYYNTPYDYKSIMHYEKTAFSRNRKNTVQRLGKSSYKLSGTVMSRTDKKEVQEMYHCSQKKSGWSKWIYTQCMCTYDNKFCTRSKVRICIGRTSCYSKNRQEHGTQYVSKRCYQKDMCLDHKKYALKCPGWAIDGQCKKNKTWMSKYCCFSCLEDYSKYRYKCPGWARKGECENNKKWMHKFCAKSCYIR